MSNDALKNLENVVYKVGTAGPNQVWVFKQFQNFDRFCLSSQGDTWAAKAEVRWLKKAQRVTLFVTLRHKNSVIRFCVDTCDISSSDEARQLAGNALCIMEESGFRAGCRELLKGWLNEEKSQGSFWTSELCDEVLTVKRLSKNRTGSVTICTFTDKWKFDLQYFRLEKWES